MDFEKAQAYLTAALTFGIQLGLHRMNRLMELLNHPEHKLRYIHIAGTNGKGSVTSYCASILATAGLKVGVYTSPYLVRLTERIRVIKGRSDLLSLLKDETTGEIKPCEFARVLTTVRDAVEQMLAEGGEHPTEFELITAAAFLYFASSQCDVVVLETGLGGRLDSTNVISNPLACVITALGYDHMDRLGQTLAEIAREKSGIIKPGCPVFLYNPSDLDLPPPDAAAARDVIISQCQLQNAPLQVISKSEIELIAYDWSGQTFIDHQTNLELKTSLLGVFQPMNAILAARVCKTLNLASDDAIREGIRLSRWPARLELLRHNPPILLDGAHNPQGCQALADALSRLLPGRPVVFLAGMLQDKDYEGMLHAVLDHSLYHPAAFVCVTPDNLRALPAEKLAECVRNIGIQLHKPADSGYNTLDAVYAVDNPSDGAKLALKLADQKNMALCAFGSLYMVGSIRKRLTIQEDGNWTGKI